MDWFSDLLTGEGAAHTIFILALITVSGLALGQLKVRGIGLGIAGVLFAGLAFGHFGLRINHEVLEFLREFGLILFVYAIGVQVGPGFMASLKRQGALLNGLAAAIVVSGALMTLLVAYLGKIPMPIAVGLFSGATTNTPSLAAAQQALRELPNGAANVSLPGVGYAVAYPFGIAGIIFTMLLARAAFRVNVNQEVAALAAEQQSQTPSLTRRNLRVSNANLNGLEVKNIPALGESGVVFSRLMRGGVVQSVQAHTVLQEGDILLSVGTPEQLDKLRLVIGEEAHEDVFKVPAALQFEKILVTQKRVAGKTVRELDLSGHGVTITRILRAGIELTPGPDVHLQFGDTVRAVGTRQDLDYAAQELGNSVKELNHPQIIPVFVGIVLGVILGSLPIQLPGMPAPVKLGLAGGPLLAAIILSSWGKAGPLVWYLPASAIAMTRELGIILFLACVGLKSGEQFVPALLGGGWQWMLWAALITLVPLLLVALYARLVYKMNYATLCGLLAGSMTDPPALAFAGNATDSEFPSLSYATVYPLVMLLRVVAAQILVLFFAR